MAVYVIVNLLDRFIKMALTHLLLIYVVISPMIFNTVSSDIIQPSAKTVQKGQSVQLTVQKQANEIIFDDLDWIFGLEDNSDVVVSYNVQTHSEMIYSSYKGRVDFNTGNFSLTLKNMQETDSGLYRARASGESNIIIGLYNVTVVTSSHGSTTGSVSLTWIIFLFLLGAMMI